MLGLMLGLGSCSAQDQPTEELQAQVIDHFRKTGIIKPTEIKESSGATASYHRPDAFWTINDSGHSAIVYCLSIEGDLLAAVSLDGANNRDWESMSRFAWDGKHYLVVADIGDNQSRYDRCLLYFFPEPLIEGAEKPLAVKIVPTAIEFNYPDGSRDCECLAIDPATNDIWLFEKLMQLNSRRKPHVYRIPSSAWLTRLTKKATSAAQQIGGNSESESQSRLEATRLDTINHRFITGGEFSPDGNQLILRTYTHIIHFQKSETENWVEKFPKLKPTLLPLPIQNQGEAITFFPDSKSALVTSEGVRQPIWLIDLAVSLKEAKESLKAEPLSPILPNRSSKHE